MKICIYGAGGIGGYLGAKLSLAGHDVTLIARGAHLAAMQKDGLRLHIAGAIEHAHPRAVADPSQAGPQDYVILGLKAHQISAIADRLGPLLAPDTAVVTAANGIPWWYFHHHDGPERDWVLDSVDPGRRIWNAVGPERAIGCVVYPACHVAEPGVIVHTSDNRFTLGEPDGSSSPRCTRLSEALQEAGFKAPVRRHIRNEIWIKLWGNACFNPISALTGATLDAIVADEGTGQLARAIMAEVQTVAESLGVRFGMTMERRIAGAAQVGAHKTSMLQDLERGRELEIDAIVGAVHELAGKLGIATPNLDAVLALVRQRARTLGLYR